MNTFGEKRKNDERRHFPWRTTLLLVIGFTLGVVVTLLFAPASSPSPVYVSGNEDFGRMEISSVRPAPNNAQNDPFLITATYIIEQATQMAGGIFVQPDNAQAEPLTDSFYATATHLVEQVTATQAAILTATAGS